MLIWIQTLLHFDFAHVSALLVVHFDLSHNSSLAFKVHNRRSFTSQVDEAITQFAYLNPATSLDQTARHWTMTRHLVYIGTLLSWLFRLNLLLFFPFCFTFNHNYDSFPASKTTGFLVIKFSREKPATILSDPNIETLNVILNSNSSSKLRLFFHFSFFFYLDYSSFLTFTILDDTICPKPVRSRFDSAIAQFAYQNLQENEYKLGITNVRIDLNYNFLALDIASKKKFPYSFSILIGFFLST